MPVTLLQRVANPIDAPSRQLRGTFIIPGGAGTIHAAVKPRHGRRILTRLEIAKPGTEMNLRRIAGNRTGNRNGISLLEYVLKAPAHIRISFSINFAIRTSKASRMGTMIARRWNSNTRPDSTAGISVLAEKLRACSF